jgi:hypothetical protein|tara:strand:- start:295 stop:444 length:150 start_codon:yes stop_codon:yes gene_type:complete
LEVRVNPAGLKVIALRNLILLKIEVKRAAEALSSCEVNIKVETKPKTDK